MEFLPESKESSNEFETSEKRKKEPRTLRNRKDVVFRETSAFRKKRSDGQRHKGYSVFFSNHIKKLKSEGSLPSKPGSAGKAIGIIWNSMTDEEKMVYHLAAEKMNLEKGINPQNTPEQARQVEEPKRVNKKRKKSEGNSDDSKRKSVGSEEDRFKDGSHEDQKSNTQDVKEDKKSNTNDVKDSAKQDKSIGSEEDCVKDGSHEDQKSNTNDVKDMAKQLGFRSVSSVNDLMQRLMKQKKKGSLDLCLDKIGNGCKGLHLLYVTLGGTKPLPKYPKKKAIRKRIHDIVVNAFKKERKAPQTRPSVKKKRKISSEDNVSLSKQTTSTSDDNVALSKQTTTSTKSNASELESSAHSISMKCGECSPLLPKSATENQVGSLLMKETSTKTEEDDDEEEKKETNLKEILAILFDQSGNLQGL